MLPRLRLLPSRRRRAAAPATAAAAPSSTTPSCILLGIVALVGALAGLLALANRSSSLAPDFLAEFVLYALVGHQPHDPGGARLRARAQHRQAGRRAAPGAAVRALPRQARGGAARDDAHPGGARAASSAASSFATAWIAGSTRRWSEVLASAQRHRRRLLPGAAARSCRRSRQRLARRLGPLDVAAADPAVVQAAVQSDEPPDHVGARRGVQR